MTMSWEERTKCDVCPERREIHVVAGAPAWHKLHLQGGNLALDVCPDCRKHRTLFDLIELVLSKQDRTRTSDRDLREMVATGRKRKPRR